MRALWLIAALGLGACEAPKPQPAPPPINPGETMHDQDEAPESGDGPQEKGGEGTWHPGKGDDWTTEGPVKQPTPEPEAVKPVDKETPRPAGGEDTWHPGKPEGWPNHEPQLDSPKK